MTVVGHEFDAHQAYLVLGVVGVVLVFFIGIFERRTLRVAPVVQQLLLVVGLDDVIYIVVYI